MTPIRDAVLETMRAFGAMLGLNSSVCDKIFAELADDIALAYAQSAAFP